MRRQECRRGKHECLRHTKQVGRRKRLPHNLYRGGFRGCLRHSPRVNERVPPQGVSQGASTAVSRRMQGDRILMLAGHVRASPRGEGL